MGPPTKGSCDEGSHLGTEPDVAATRIAAPPTPSPTAAAADVAAVNEAAVDASDTDTVLSLEAEAMAAELKYELGLQCDGIVKIAAESAFMIGLTLTPGESTVHEIKRIYVATFGPRHKRRATLLKGASSESGIDLTDGAIQSMLTNDRSSSQTLQVLGVKKISDQLGTACVLSDGKQCLQAMLATGLNHLVEKGQAPLHPRASCPHML